MKRLFVGGIILFITACTQEPVAVDYKGDEFYGHVPQNTMLPSSHDAFVPREQITQERPAQVPAVGVTDLAPPPPPAQNIEKPVLQSPKIQASSQFIWPVSDGKIILHFGPKAGNRSNDGINISVAEGEPIWAAAAGTVVYAGSDLKGYGNMVIIRHKGGWMTAYAHARSIAVKKDDAVKQGDIIGYVGMTGGVKSPQLHFAIRDGKTPVDPELYLPKNIGG